MQQDYKGHHSLPEAEFNIADDHRRLMIRLLFVLASIVVLTFSLLNFLEGLRILPVIQLCCGLFGLASLHRIQKTRHLTRWTFWFLLTLFIIVTFAVYTVEGSDTNFVWIYIMPVLAYSMLGLRPGLLLSLPFVLICIGGIIWHYWNIYEVLTARTIANLVNLAAAGLLVILFMHYYERGRADTQRQLLHMAATDALTNLPNRGEFQRTLRSTIAHSARKNTPFTLIVLDLDHFKQVNDTHGHDAGDQVLKQLGHCLQRNIRASDFVARLGGEEFAIIFRDAAGSEAGTLAEAIRQAIADMPFHYDDTGLSLRATLGVATFPDDGKDSTTLYKMADERLYRGKREGRDRVVTA